MRVIAGLAGTRSLHLYRLYLVTNNSRFLNLPRGPRNLGSRVLLLCTRRLVRDWLIRFGHDVLLAETFVDPALFRGTVYCAANWIEVRCTRGFARGGAGCSEHAGREREAHGCPGICGNHMKLGGPAASDLPIDGGPFSWRPLAVGARLDDGTVHRHGVELDAHDLAGRRSICFRRGFNIADEQVSRDCDTDTLGSSLCLAVTDVGVAHRHARPLVTKQAGDHRQRDAL